MTDDRFKTGGALDALPNQPERLAAKLRGRDIRGYKVGQLIGSGGMGYVLQATRIEGDFEREAAVKVVPAPLAASDLAHRFRTEVHILGKLNHPAIAQLYDAGETEEGWPYFIMEYVDGLPIDRYCTDNSLPIDARIRVLIDVCRAVRFAHSRLIIHRDIKPSNVLVTHDGKPKLLDFGIAKILKEDSSKRTVGQRPMTPRYASPEQLLGQDITTGSDIYQLGILCLNVLSDQTHAANSSLQEAIQRAASGRDFELSTSVRRTLPADVSAIISHCLHADADDRYADSNALIADLESYLGGYPVMARRGSAWYRVRKLIHRNATAATISALAVATIVGGTAYYTSRLANARHIAEQRAQTSAELLQAMSGMIADTYSDLIGTRTSRTNLNDETQLKNEPLRVIIDRTQRLIDAVITDDPVVQAELLVLQGITNRELSRFSLAQRQLEEALQLHKQLGNHTGSIIVLTQLATLDGAEAKHTRAQERIDAALRLIERHDIDPELIARVNIVATHTAVELGQTESALAYSKMAIDILENLPGGPTLALADAYEETSAIYGRMEQRDDLRYWAQKSIALYTELEGPLYRDLGPAYSGVAISFAMDGEYDQAREYFNREVSIAQANFGDEHVRTAVALLNLGGTLRRLGEYQLAIGEMLRAKKILESLSTEGSQQLVALAVNLGNTYRDIGNLNEASDVYEAGLARSATEGGDQRHRAFLLNNSGELLYDRGFVTQGNDRLEQALQLKIQIMGPDHPSTARTMLLLARAQLASGNISVAKSWIDKAEKLYLNQYGAEHNRMAFWELTHGMYLHAINDAAGARPWLERGFEHRMAAYNAQHIDVVSAALLLARLETSTQNLDRARYWLSVATPGIEQLNTAQLERIEAAIVTAELLTAEGREAAGNSATVQALALVEQHFPDRRDWRDRLTQL